MFFFNQIYKTYIFDKERVNLKKSVFKPSIVLDQEIFSNQEITEEEIFETELEDYVNFYRQIESIVILFKKIHFSRNIEESKKNEVFNQKVIKELKKHEDEEKVKEEELNKNDELFETT